MPRIRSTDDILNIMQTLAPTSFMPPSTAAVPTRMETEAIAPWLSGAAGAGYGAFMGGPVGAALGSVLGPTLGGLFKKKKTRYVSPLAPGAERMAGTPALQAYQYGNQYMRGITPELAGYAGREAGLSPQALGVFSQIEQLSPLRTAAWAEPMRNQLDPEVRQAISAMIGLVPTKLGIGAYYGDVARGVQETVSPELAAARQYIASRLGGEIPEDLLAQYRQDLRGAQAARGLSYGPASAAEEAYRLAGLREQQRESMLGPAMTMGYQTLGMTGFPEMAQIGPVNFAPVGSGAWQQKELEWAKLGTYLGFAGNMVGGVGSILGATL